MPIAPPFPASPAHNALFPALYLYPLNDTWAPKHIALTSAHTKIGRQTSSKTAPGERNGFFDSKVLSRQHAEVWEEGGKIFIKDVKSSNGTFINGERLSSEGHESEPFELKSDDIVEFGIDIVGEDNKTIIHHKVAARVVCVFSEQDAAVAARAEQHQAAAAAQHAQQQQQQHLNLNQHQQQQHLHHQQQQQLHQGGMGAIPPPGGHHAYLNAPNGLGIGTGGGAGAFPFSSGSSPSSSSGSSAAGNAGPNAGGPQRRPLAHNGLGGMGAPPSLARAPGKSGTGLSFDVILSRLQGEVQKSRETGAELGGLAGLMGDVEGVLGGRGPPNLQSFPTHLPPVRPPTEAAPQPPPSGPVPPPPGAPPAASTSPVSEQSSSAAATSSAIPAQVAGPSTSADGTSTSAHGSPQPAAAAASVSVLQAQLAETQASLAAHLERVRALEGVLKEQEAIKREVGVLRGLVEGRRAGESADGERKHQDEEAQAHRQAEHEQEAEERETGEIRYEPEELALLERDDRDSLSMGLEDVLEEDEDEDGDDDDDDDGRSVGTVMAHELERVDEEDEDALMEEERAAMETEQDHRHHDEEEEDHFRASSSSSGEDEQSAFDHERDDDDREADRERGHEDTQQEIAEQERRRAEDLGVGRPRTPEPSLFGLGIGLGMGVRERRSPLSNTGSGTDVKGERSTSSPTPAPSHSTSTPTASSAAALAPPSSVTTEDVHAQVERLAAQVGAVLALTSALEKQHASAQGTIRELEDKVRSLEGLLDRSQKTSTPSTLEPEHDKAGSDTSVDSDGTLINPDSDAVTDEGKDKDVEPPSALAAWTRSIAGQWTSLQADWTRERTALAKAKEEWEARSLCLDNGLSSLDSGLSRLDGGLARLDAGLVKVDGTLARVDGGLGKVDGVQSAVANLLSAQERVREAVREQGGRLEAHIAAYQAHVHASETRAAHGGAWGANGDAVKQRLNGGLVTPPSPRSQSSDSTRYRRRRRRSSGSRRAGSKERSGEEGESEDEGADEEGKHGIRRALGLAAATASAAAGVSTGSLVTPASSIYGLRGAEDPAADASTADKATGVTTESGLVKNANGVLTAPATRANSSSISEADSLDGSLDAILANAEAALEARTEERAKAIKHGQATLNMQTAVGVVLLSVAAAAVFWKVKPE